MGIAVIVLILVRHFSPDSGSPAAFEQRDADRIVADMASGDAQRISDAIGVPDGQALEPGAVEQLAQLRLVMDASTFTTDADGVSSVTGTVTDASGVTTAAVFYLAQVDGVWVVIDVMPQ